jgi:hypothetical protein
VRPGLRARFEKLRSVVNGQCPSDVRQTNLRSRIRGLEPFQQTNEPPGLEVLLDESDGQHAGTKSLEQYFAVERRVVRGDLMVDRELDLLVDIHCLPRSTVREPLSSAHFATAIAPRPPQSQHCVGTP